MAATTVTAPELNFEAVQKVLIQPLEAASTFLASGPKIVDSSNPVRFPKLGGLVTPDTTTPTTPDWIGEGEDITFKDVDFGELELMPSTMKSIKTITKFSNELARQSVVALDQALKDRLVRDVATKLDKQLWGKAGDGITTPMGILGQAGTQEIDLEGAAASLDDLIDAWGLCLGANVNMAGLRWVMRPEQFVALRKIKESTTSARPVLTPDPTADAVFRLLGAPVTITPNLPLYDSADTDSIADESTIILCDFSQVVVVRDLSTSVTILRELFAGSDSQGIRTVTRYDAGLANPQAVVKISNVGVTAA